MTPKSKPPLWAVVIAAFFILVALFLVLLFLYGITIRLWWWALS